MSDLKYIFTGGGTAGHVFPGLAVAEVLVEKGIPRENLLWIGSGKGMEEEIVRRYGIPYAGIPSGKLRRYFSLRNFSDIFRILAGYLASRRIIKKFRPAALFSKGGYVTVPPALAAKHLGIPVITHESDLTPGLATRLNARFCDRVLVAYDETKNRIPPRTGQTVTVTGNPVRREIFEGDGTKGREILGLSKERPVILVLGGSQGARQVNLLVDANLDAFLKRASVVHQMGALDYAPSTREGYVTCDLFGEDFPHILASADLIISRAGAGTLWENAAAAKPMILIPLGLGSSRGDQGKNAATFEAAGAARVLEGDAATAENLSAEVFRLLDDRSAAESLGRAAEGLLSGNPAETIADIILNTKGEA